MGKNIDAQVRLDEVERATRGEADTLVRRSAGVRLGQVERALTTPGVRRSPRTRQAQQQASTPESTTGQF